MKVAILGSGDVAQALGRGFAGRGHEVMIGSRTPDSEKLQAWKKAAGKKASTGTSERAVMFGEVVVIATLGAGAKEAIGLAGPQNFAGKVVIDVTNPLDFSKGMPPGLFVGTSDSLGEQNQRLIPRAQVVKAFNTVSSIQMIDPKVKGAPATMMICGDDAAAKKKVEAILKEFGWARVMDVGGIDGARWLEAIVPLWVRVGAALNTWQHMFVPATP
jgi:hypothetical protein